MNNLRMELQVKRFCSQVLELFGNFKSGSVWGSLCNSFSLFLICGGGYEDSVLDPCEFLQ